MVVSGEQEKRRRCGITELPDCMMESIVSLLPLKDAVNTILASPPQWKHLSHPILTRRNLEFNYRNVLGSKNQRTIQREAQSREFLRRVSKYLQQYQGNKVDSFTLEWHVGFGFHFDARSRVRLDDWIRFATTKGVEELHLRLDALDDYYVFPPSLHAGSTLNLKHLSLQGCILRHPNTDCDAFHQLTTLSLSEVIFDQYLMANLFSVCVLLESLTLNWCPMTGSYYSLVAGDRLTHLKVLHCEGNETEISALNLVSLEYIPYCTCRSFDIKAPQLSRIFFSNIRGGNTLVPQALTQFALCPGLETLHLRTPAELPRISSIPNYENLKQLNLDIDLIQFSRQDKDDVDINFVLDLVKAAPLLEELVMMVYGGDLSGTNPRETRNHSRFTNEHLRIVEMQGFMGNWYETELAICIIEISPKLEKLVINQLGRYYKGDGEFDPRGNYSEQKRGVVEEKLKGVKTNARIIFLQGSCDDLC